MLNSDKDFPYSFYKAPQLEMIIFMGRKQEYLIYTRSDKDLQDTVIQHSTL